MIVYFLGLDPSTKCTGYCVMNENKDLIEYGKIDISNIDNHGEKLAVQYKAIEKLVEKYRPAKVLCEDQFSKVNVDTLKKLSRTTGTYMLLANLKGIPFETIFPTSWRKIFHGYGSAKKEETFDKVCTIYEFSNLNFKKDNDITDAIGICWSLIDLYKGENVA